MTYEERQRRIEEVCEKLELRAHRTRDPEAYIKAFEEFEATMWGKHGDGCSHLGFCDLCN